MFFYLSKIFWLLANPSNLFLIVLTVGVFLLWGRKSYKTGRRIITFCVLVGLFISFVPVAVPMRGLLENRFPALTQFPENITGVVIAGGIIDPVVSQQRGQASVGGAVERLLALVELGQRYPDAKIIFSAGSGDPLQQQLKEAHYVGPLLQRMGFDPSRVIYEDQSRNTVENAINTYAIAAPKPGETWLLVTSAFHMPRAYATFRKAGWRITPYPVDFNVTQDAEWTVGFNFANLSIFSGIFHEYLGLLFYRLSGKTDTLFPAPETVS